VQTYTARPSNSRLNGHGELVLTARREPAKGSDGILRPYTSARLSTLGKFQVPPGSYVEATIRAPVGVGVRPAFWLLGANFPRVGWPASGELDILEASQVSTDMVRQAMHMPSLTSPSDDAPYGEFAPGGFTKLPTSRDAIAHQYGVYFDDRVAQFYVNRRPTLKLTKAEAFEKDRAWPFGQEQVIVLNIAVGADPSTTRFPVSMTVSDIRIWHGGVPLPSAQTGASILFPAISNHLASSWH
jgi:beta-glucanase (GH16 family)